MKLKPLFFIFAIITLLTGPAAASESKSPSSGFEGVVTGILDGDNIIAKKSNGIYVRIRLANIDAPEMGQPFGPKAKNSLRELVYKKPVFIQITDKTQHGVVVGQVTLENIDVSSHMVSIGQAWVNESCVERRLKNLESKAKDSKYGLWAMAEATKPWEWRQMKKVAQYKSIPTRRPPEGSRECQSSGIADIMEGVEVCRIK